MTPYLLKLYVVGQTARSQRAVANLRQVCEQLLRDQYELLIVDILEHPEAAEADRILATPTLIKARPLPQRRIIGDLSDYERVLWALGITRPLEFPRGGGEIVSSA